MAVTTLLLPTIFWTPPFKVLMFEFCANIKTCEAEANVSWSCHSSLHILGVLVIVGDGDEGFVQHRLLTFYS